MRHSMSASQGRYWEGQDGNARQQARLQPCKATGGKRARPHGGTSATSDAPLPAAAAPGPTFQAPSGAHPTALQPRRSAGPCHPVPPGGRGCGRLQTAAPPLAAPRPRRPCAWAALQRLRRARCSAGPPTSWPRCCCLSCCCCCWRRPAAGCWRQAAAGAAARRCCHCCHGLSISWPLPLAAPPIEAALAGCKAWLGAGPRAAGLAPPAEAAPGRPGRSSMCAN